MPCVPTHTIHLLKRLEEDKTDIIKELGYNEGHGWSNGDLRIKDAVEGSGIAAATYNEEIRIYYQTLEGLYLKEYCRSNWGPWVVGELHQSGRCPPVRVTDRVFLFLFPKANSALEKHRLELR